MSAHTARPANPAMEPAAPRRCLRAAVHRQPLWQKRLSVEFLGAFDPDGAHRLQPGVHWEISNHVRLDLFYNEFGGSEKGAGRLGSLFRANGVFLRFTYGF